MKRNTVNAISKTIGWLAGFLGFSALFGWWLEWILESIVEKEISYWLAFGFMVLVAAMVSDKIKPYICAAMVFATGYIWFFN